jgi:hypothetical protein
MKNSIKIDNKKNEKYEKNNYNTCNGCYQRN